MAREIAILVLLVAASFWKLAFSREYTFLEAPDIANQVLPWLQLQAVSIRQGFLPLWDPYSLGGQPLVGQLQPAVTSPFTYLLLVLPLQDGRLDPVMLHYWFVALHAIAGIFAYLLLRDLRLSPAATILGAYFFAIGGYVGNTNWPQYLAGALWLPLIALFLIRCLRGPGATANAAMAGAFLGLSWLSGHHQVPYFTSLAIGATFLAVAAARRTLAMLAPSAVVLFGMAALVAAVQVLPAVEYGRLSVRWLGAGDPIGWSGKVPYQVHLDHALGLGDLLYVLFPGGEQTISNPAIGIVALAFAIAGAARSRPFLYLALASLAFALARVNPVHRLLYEVLPGLDKARSPATALSLTHFAVAVLTAYGVDQLPRLRRRWPWLAGLSAAAMAWLLLFSGAGDNSYRFACVGVIGVALAAVLRWGASASPALIAALLLLEHSMSAGGNYRKLDDRSRPAVLPSLMGGTGDIAAFLRSSGVPPVRAEIHFDDVLFNFGLWHGVETLSGYLPGALEANHRLGWWDAPVLSLYGVRYTVSRAPVRDGQREVFTAARGGLKVFENPAPPMPRVWAVHRVRVVADAARQVRSGNVAFPVEAVAESALPMQLETCEGPSQASVTAHRIHDVSIDAAMACRGLVVLADNFYPGWEASVDGAPAPIFRVNASLRAVVVEKGRHRVEMRYRPGSVYVGLALTLIGLAIALYYFFALKRASTAAQFTAPHQAFK